MSKFNGLLAVVFIFLTAPAAMANITLTSAYFVADAEVYSNLFGSDSDYSEGFAPVEAYAAVGGQEGGAAAMATSNLLNLSGWSAVDSLPDHIGAAVSSAGTLLLELTSDTPWILDVETSFSVDFSTNGLAGLTAEALVTDLDDNPIYSYDVAVDGIIGSTTIAAGSYNVAFYITSFAIVPEVSDVFEFANSAVELSANVSVIPAPSAVVLGFIGVGLVGWLRRRGMLNG